MQHGRIRWLLRTALPLGSTIRIVYNGDLLTPSKVDVEVDTEWTIGDGLGIPSIVLPNDESRSIIEHADNVSIEGIDGVVTGFVRLYKDKISGGKSDDIASSNGFLINIRGRVINPLDPYFGLENLNHAAWSRFRATVRVDGLDTQLAVNREGLLQGPTLEVFRAFLRALFNKARSTYESATQAAWPHAGEVLADKWGTLPLKPLRRVVEDGLGSVAGTPDFIDASTVSDRQATLRDWRRREDSAPYDVVREVVFEQLAPEKAFVKYELGSRRIVVNSDHPFVQEHGETHEQKQLLRDMALADLLTQAYMADIGLDDDQLRQIETYRDQMLRLLAQLHRRTGGQIADMLLKATNHVKGLERAVGDALEYLGFVVRRLAQSGQPEGVAISPSTPGTDDARVSYSFTYDAKSTTHTAAKTGNINIAGLARHRRNHGADYTLVVAPDFQEGALEDECRHNSVTPMRASDLAALLMFAAATGPLDLQRLRSLFDLRTPAEVHAWGEQLTHQQAADTPGLTLGLLLRALVEVGFHEPDAVTTSVVAHHIRHMTGVKCDANRRDVAQLVSGLAVLAPGLIRIVGDSIIMSVTAQKLREIILSQIRDIPPKYRFGIDEALDRLQASDST